MTDINNLMQLEGAVAAFQFSDRGELGEHNIADGSGLSTSTLDLLAHVFVANMAIAAMQARGWENMTGQGGFYPVEGFTLVGLEWSAVANGNYGVIMGNEKADYELAYKALSA